MKVFDYFDKAFCINLDSRPDRWNDALAEFKKVGIEDQVERFPAVKKEPPQTGADGCAESHIECIKLAKQQGYKNILLFEDDVEFVVSDRKIIDNFIGSLKKHANWGLVYLGSNYHPKKPTVPVRVTDNLIELRDCGVFTTHAYALNESAFDFVLNNIQVPIDSFYAHNFFLSGLPVFHALPLLCSQRTDYSDILNRDVSYKLVENFNKLISKCK